MTYSGSRMWPLIFLIVSVMCSYKESEPVPEAKPEIGGEAFDGEVGVWPISGTRESDELASVYGPRILSGSYDFHRGFDVQVPTGTLVHAIMKGVVVRMEEGMEGSSLERFGKFVVLAHAATSEVAKHQTVYLHLNEFLVNMGDEVEMGEVIANSGKSGVGINTEHLHFEYHIGENTGKQNRLHTRNPLRILPYSKETYALTVAKENNKLAIEIAQKDSAPDLVAFDFLPADGTSHKMIDFEARIGINLSNEDENPYDGVFIEPVKFNTLSDQYVLKFEWEGDWKQLSSLSLRLKNSRDSITFFTFSL